MKRNKTFSNVTLKLTSTYKVCETLEVWCSARGTPDRKVRIQPLAGDWVTLLPCAWVRQTLYSRGKYCYSTKSSITETSYDDLPRRHKSQKALAPSYLDTLSRRLLHKFRWGKRLSQKLSISHQKSFPGQKSQRRVAATSNLIRSVVFSLLAH